MIYPYLDDDDDDDDDEAIQVYSPASDSCIQPMRS